MDSSDDEIFKSTISQIPTDKSNNLINELETPSATVNNNVKAKNPSENTAENSSLATSSETIVNNQPKSKINSNSTICTNNKTSNAENSSNSLSYIDDSFKNFQQKYFVEVKNPNKLVDNMGSYMTYQIETIEKDTQKPADGSNLTADKVYTVKRRYNDFKWLYDTLSASEPFRFNGPLPPKNVITIDRFSMDFVTDRMIQLNEFMQYLAKHPIFSESKIFHLFLENQLDFKTETLKCLNLLEHQNMTNSMTSSSIGVSFNGSSNSSNPLATLSNLTNSLSNALNNRVRDQDFQDFYDYIQLYKDRLLFTLRVTARVLRETEDAQSKTMNMPSYLKRLSELETMNSKLYSANQIGSKIFTTDETLVKILDDLQEIIAKEGESYKRIMVFLQEKLMRYLELQTRICDEILNAVKNRDKYQFDLQNIQEEANKQKLNSQRLAHESNYGAQDAMQKARYSHIIQSLENRENQAKNSKLEADKIVRNEMLFWKEEKTCGLKQNLTQMSKENIILLDNQIALYENLLEGL